MHTDKMKKSLLFLIKISVTSHLIFDSKPSLSSHFIYIGAIHPNRFKLQCDLLHKKVRKVGDCCVGIFNKVTGEIIVQYYAKAQRGQ